MDCPVCGMAFPEGEIEAHVIQCLDEQQVREDERLARELDDAQNGTASGSPSQRVGLFASHVGDGGPSLPKKELPVVRAFRPQRRAVATGEHADRPRQDGVLATLRTDPRQTLLAREEDRENLVGLLHQRFQIGELDLVYQNSVHGNSLATLYGCVKSHSPLIIVIEDANHFLFGCFLTTAIQRKSSSFTGTGEAFLFSLRPECAAYRWSGFNGYYVSTSADSICIGCGGGGFGLRVGMEGDVTQGASNHCHTFINPPLASEEFFHCQSVEVWRLV